LPDLHAHFKDETISASLFSSAWFITLFSNSLTHQTTDELSPNLLLFWDQFVVQGYLVVYKLAIILLRLFEEKLVSLSFEQILSFLQEVPTILFRSGEGELEVGSDGV